MAGETGPRSLPLIAGLAAIIACLMAAALYYGVEPRTPVADEVFYLQHTWGIHAHDTYVRAIPNGGVQGPGLAAPGIPYLLAALMDLDAGFADRVHCWLSDARKSGECAPGIGSFRVLAVALMVVSSVLIFLTGVIVSGHSLVGVLAVVAWMGTDLPWRFSNALLTETLTLPCLFAAALLFALGVTRGRWPYLMIASLMLGLAALARPIHVYVGPMVVLTIPLAALLLGRLPWRRVLGLLLAGSIGYAGVAIPGSTIQPKREEQSSGYGAKQLCQRIAYNDMTLTEYVAGWVFWLPDFGDSLSKELFGQTNIDRLTFSHPDSFYQAGAPAVAAEAQAATGVNVWARESVPGAPSPLTWLIERKVLGEPLTHGAVTALLTWRGLFVGKLIGLFGAIALFGLLVWQGWDPSGTRRRVLLALLLPGLIALILQAGSSINIPRYNAPLIQVHAVAIATVLVALGHEVFARLIGPGVRSEG